MSEKIDHAIWKFYGIFATVLCVVKFENDDWLAAAILAIMSVVSFYKEKP
jgi:hypothetical protein